jgi:hypothetical protein
MRNRKKDEVALYRIPEEQFSPRQWAEVATFCVMGAWCRRAAATPPCQTNGILAEMVRLFSGGDWQTAALLALSEWNIADGSQPINPKKARRDVMWVLKQIDLLVQKGTDLKERAEACGT